MLRISLLLFAACLLPAALMSRIIEAGPPSGETRRLHMKHPDRPAVGAGG